MFAVGVLSSKNQDPVSKLDVTAFIKIQHFFDWLPKEIHTPQCESLDETTTTSTTTEAAQLDIQISIDGSVEIDIE